MASIIVGSNSFQSSTSFVVIGKDEKGGIILGGFGGPIKFPAIWINVKNNVGYLNALLQDADNETVLKITDGNIEINKDNIYTANISKDNIEVVNQYGETTLDLRNENGTVIFNGDFYMGKDHIVASDKGLFINPRQDSV